MKNIINKLLLGVFTIGLVSSLEAQDYKHLYAIDDIKSEVIKLDADQVAEVVNAWAPYYRLNSRDYPGGFIVIQYDFDERITNNHGIWHNNKDREIGGLKIVGPCKISVAKNPDGAWVRAAFKITSLIDTKNGGQVLVLPESSDSKFKVLMESSTDLVNWKEDQPGSKDPSDKKRFFRLRAVKE